MQHGYRILPLRAALTELGGSAARAAAPAAVITVDDGHRSIYAELFPLIRRHHLPITLFIYPSAISNAKYALTWAQLREMQDSGLVDVESHTYWHPNFRTERRHRSPADYQRFVNDQLRRSKSVLESRLGRTVDLLAWPYGIVDGDLEAAARRAGYVAAFAYDGGVAAVGTDIYAMPRIPVTDQDRAGAFAALIGPTLHSKGAPPR